MASALVQMTPFSPSQMSDILMVASENSLESFPGSRDESGNKRTGTSDGDEDQDRSHVKKRRKQSKPNRITAVHPSTDSQQTNEQNVQGTNDLEFSETGEHFLSERLTGNAVNLIASEEYEHFKRANQDQSKVQNDNHNSTVLTENLHSSSVPLNLSNIKSSFIDSLIVPNARDSQTTNEKPVPLDNSLHSFQTSENSKTSAQENAYLPQSPTSLILPLFKQNQIQSQISQISSQMRIFNPEAFCDLCNKEFCNKYFLKTHKANKHGIYSENQSGPPLLESMPSMPFTNYFSSNSETYENSSPFQTSSSAKNINAYSQANYQSSRSTPKKAQVLPPQPQNSLFSLKSNSSGNMRALCNICQREFCNKYFVRRHKQKIHGIIDPVSKDGSMIDSQENLNFNNNSSQDKLDGSASEGEIYSGYVKQLLPSNFSMDIRESLQTPEIKIEKIKETQDKGVDRESQVTQNSLDMSTPYEAISIFQQTQNEENNKENSLTDIKLKKLGIVNADAFCEICCKEYCNKYFLRTHKLKSHGIITLDEKKDDVTNGTSNLSWFQTQTMPLNLIVNDGVSSNRDASIKGYFDTEGDECVCGVCGRYFQNQLLLKMHEVQSHANSYANSDSLLPPVQQSPKLDTIKTTAVMENEKALKQHTESYFPVVVKKECFKDSVEEDIKFTVNAENVKKLQTLILRLNNANLIENSVCDVCEKDVGHVSLLENHILKEHAALLEELGSIAEEDNSSSQSSVVLSSSSFKKECTVCQKLFYKPELFEQHMKENHGDAEYLMEPENIKGSLEQKEINSLKLFGMQSSDGLQTPTSSFCEICKKELCNKYFMKTHMQRMHGISIENGAQIGGVVCDICNKELCSKYFLRVHKQNSHGIVDELFLPQLGFDLGRNQSPLADPALKPTDQADLNHRYFTHFNEVCPICNRRFRSLKWLRAHLWNDHGEEGKEKYKELSLSSTVDLKTSLFEDSFRESNKIAEMSTYGPTSALPNSSKPVEVNQNNKEGKSSVDKQILPEKGTVNNSSFSLLINGGDSEMKQYQCSYCSFTTTILAFLFVHERSHLTTNFQFSSDQPSQCPICYQTIESKEQFEKHLQMHNASWQQSYSSNNPGQDILKSQDRKNAIKSDIIVSKTADSVGITQQDNLAHENINSLYNQDVRQNTIQSNEQEPTTDLTMQCTRCQVRCTNVQEYLEHLNKEHPYHQMDQELPSYLQQMENALSTLACNAGIPAAFAVPQMQDKVTMQPFVLEDSEYSSGTNNSITKKGKTFLSSLVFLPVKEKLKKSVTASFKLTPT